MPIWFTYSTVFSVVATGVEGSGQVHVYLVKKAERGEVYMYIIMSFL